MIFFQVTPASTRASTDSWLYPEAHEFRDEVIQLKQILDLNPIINRLNRTEKNYLN